VSSETIGALVRSAFALRHLLCLQKVQLLVYCVDGNDVAAVLQRCAVQCYMIGVHVEWHWCACGLANCVCIDSALPLPHSAAYRLGTAGLTHCCCVRT
jgi:hypothetical protein